MPPGPLRRVSARPIAPFLAALAVGFAIPMDVAAQGSPEPTVALTHVTLVDGTGGPPLPDRTILDPG